MRNAGVNMINVTLLVVCFLIGIGLRRTGRFPEGASSTLNAFIIHVPLPALTLLHIHNIELEGALVYPAIMAWVLFFIGFAFFWSVGRLAHWTPQTVGALVLTGALANTSFVGLPMIEAYFGNENGELAVGILIDQLGTYMVLSTLGIFVAALYSTSSVSPAIVAKKIILFPPFQALILALLLRPVEYPDQIEVILERLGAMLAPLALVSIGFQLRLSELRGNVKALAVGLGFKLILGPVLIMLLLTEFIGAGGRIIQVTIFEAAMGPQIGGSIIALEYKLDRSLVLLMVGVGIPLSFATLPMWWVLLQSV